MSNQPITDEEIQRLEEELASLEKGSPHYGSPTPEKKDSILILFRELINSKVSTKFGFLNNTELGNPKMAVRDELSLANYFDAEGLDNLSEYFKKKAEITVGTSLSKKGKLIDNMVTQIRKEQKMREPSEEVKKGGFFFGNKPKEPEV